MKKDRIRYNLKDSVFTSMFSVPKYLRELYISLPGSEKSVTEEEIKIENISNTIAYGIHNDLGFTVRGEKLFLIEAQSTLSPFIPQRMNSYFCRLLYDAFPFLEIEQYRSRMPSHIPEVFFAVVYTGNEDVPEYYEMEFSYFKGQTMKIKVLILTKQNTTGILRAYCIFSEEYDRNRTLYGRTKDAVLKTIEYCNECEDTVPMREYLREREEEIIDIMSDEERQRRLIDKIMRYEHETSLAEGEARGEARGVAIGEARGVAIGEAKGRKEERIKTLVEFLKEGLINEDTAAKKANMSLDDFRKTAALCCN